jgi:predicted alpha/beta superfamily hydrolase
MPLEGKQERGAFDDGPRVKIDGWEPYPGSASAGIKGTLLVSRAALRCPALPRLKRRLLAWLPPSYKRGGRRFPVIYMHDGHNLFDEAASYSGAWRVDLAMTGLAAEGTEAIVIGIPNAGVDRLLEYSPWVDRDHGGGLGAEYAQFVVDTVKPFVDESLDTSLDRGAVGLAGSSLGGNISLYGLLAHRDVFGFAAALSPAFWFAAPRWRLFLESAEHTPARIYLDVGGNEIEDDPAMSELYVRTTNETVGALTSIGYGPGELRTGFDPRGTHSETAWRERISGALRFVLTGV